MAGLFDKISTFIGATKVEDYEDEGYVEDDYYDEAEEEEQPSRGRSRQGGKQNITALPSATKQKLIIYKPVSYEDADTAIDQLKSRRPVIVNIVELISTSIETAQRVHDYLEGVAYALNGRLLRIEEGIYVLAPSNYSIGGDSSKEQ